MTTLFRTEHVLAGLGHTVRVLSPEQFRTVPCPTYREIRLALRPVRTMRRELQAFAPDAIHIATEGPLGFAARRYCRQAGLAFTTSYHTRFPEYVRARLPVPVAWTYGLLRRFHARARRTLVATPRQREELICRGFEHVVLWSRDVDTVLFRPCGRDHLNVPRPILIYVVLDAALTVAIKAALTLERRACRASAERRTWRAATEQFLDNIVDCRTGLGPETAPA